ncbi:MAG: acyl-CoA thioesterase [Pseudobdellovibrionaceae bacterium]
MSQVYKKKFSVRFRDCDPAGILFFGNIYGICHDAFEDLIHDIGIGWKNYFSTKDFLFPLIKSEADYRGPLIAGHSYEIHLFFSQIKTGSFEVTYQVMDIGHTAQTPLTVVKTVHVCLDAKAKVKCSLPPEWQKMFQQYHVTK